jgi:hypothetical protein
VATSRHSVIVFTSLLLRHRFDVSSSDVSPLLALPRLLHTFLLCATLCFLCQYAVFALRRSSLYALLLSLSESLRFAAQVFAATSFSLLSFAFLEQSVLNKTVWRPEISISHTPPRQIHCSVLLLI